MNEKRVIVLASGSPRRIELLSTLGVKPKVIKPNVDESVIPYESGRKMVKRLSKSKALAVANLLLKKNTVKPSLIIAADTTVISPVGIILGKPSSRQDAQKMLEALSGNTHRVYTAYTVLEIENGEITTRLTRAVRTKVKIRKLELNEIDRYIRTKEPMDKAGAYAAQGIGMTLIESIQGSYTNVVGLPMTELMMDLKDFFEYEPC